MEATPPSPAATSPFIKKRSKIRPSSSSSSLRSLSFQDSQDDGDAEQDDGNVAIVRPKFKKTPAGKVKEREGGGRPKSRLSFGGADDDEDGADDDAPTVIKTTPRKLLRHQPSTSSLPAPAPSAPASPSIYSKEYLNQLKAQTLSTPPPNFSAGGDQYDELTRSKFDSAALEEPSEIPTEAAIASAKERRERMRATGMTGTGGEGFIALDVIQASERKGGESRLVREEDEIGDGDDELAAYTGSLEKVPLGTKANREAAKKMRSGMEELILDAEEEDAGDEEAREWEEAQIRRGEQGRDDIGPGGGRDKRRAKKTYRPPPIPTPTPLPSLSSVSARLRASLSTLRTAHALSTSQLTHFSHEQADLDSQEHELREEVIIAERKRRWFADFKDWAEVVEGFLEEKYPALEAIEATNVSIQRERLSIVSQRRFADFSDQVSLFTGAQIPIVHVPKDQTEEDTPFQTEEDTPFQTSEKMESLLPKSSSRVSRRQSRAQRLSKLPTNPFGDPPTDDELPTSDSLQLSTALTTLEESIGKLFSDVKAPDFRDPNLGIKKKFEEWRRLWREEYENAFGGLGLVAVWEFWARVELGGWNPFEISQLAPSPAGLEKYAWHIGLGAYGHRDEGSGEGDDESEQVINSLVASVVIPKLEKLAKEAWDPWSGKQNKAALKWVDEVSYCVERGSAKFINLIHTFLTTLQTAIFQSLSLLSPHLSLLTLPQNAFDPSTFAVRNEFATSHLKLVQNSLKWRRWGKSLRVDGQTIDEMILSLVGGVVLPVVEAGWGTGGQEVGQKVLEILPADLVPPALRRRLEGER